MFIGLGGQEGLILVQGYLDSVYADYSEPLQWLTILLKNLQFLATYR